MLRFRYGSIKISPHCDTFGLSFIRAFSSKDASSAATTKPKNTGVKKKAPISKKVMENMDKKKEVEMLKQFLELAEKTKKLAMLLIFFCI